MEGGWVQKRLYDTVWSDEKEVEEGTEKHRLYHCPCWKGGQKPDPRKSGELGAEEQEHHRRIGSGKEESRRTP